jgi:hypothetical protein
MPWIITFGPLDDEADWEPVVCGPYEYPHALALAEEIVADDELMAVMEPMLGLASPEEIRREIDLARVTAEQDFDLGDELDGPDGPDGLDDMEIEADHGPGGGEHPPLPAADEVRAGMARIAHRLAQPD